MKPTLYAGIGADLVHFNIDVDSATLIRRGTVRLPALIQYAWPHASREFLYVVSSDKMPKMEGPGTTHRLSTFRIGPKGELSPHGEDISLADRPVHCSTDIPSDHVLVAYASPPGLSVHEIKPDGTVGELISQQSDLQVGAYPHQIRLHASNKWAFVVDRGRNKKPGDPGSIQEYEYSGGKLRHTGTVAPDGGHAFAPRHLDFHPTQPWVYASLELQHKLSFHRLDNGRLSDPVCMLDTLAKPDAVKPGQCLGTVHVHPKGHCVYVPERGTREVDGVVHYVGGENTLLVFAIDPESGEPILIQRVQTQGMHARTFAVEPSGQLLIAAHKSPVNMPEGEGKHVVPANLELYRIADDGKLTLAGSHDIDTNGQAMFWAGIV